MKPIAFPGVTTIFGKDQPEYLDLPAYVDEKTGRVVTCWALTFKERVRMLLTGELWIAVLTFGRPFQPILPTTELDDDAGYELIFD